MAKSQRTTPDPAPPERPETEGKVGWLALVLPRLGGLSLAVGALILLLSCAYFLAVPSAALTPGKSTARSPISQPGSQAPATSATATLPSDRAQTNEASAQPEKASPAALPGRAMPQSERACLGILKRAGVDYERVSKAAADGIAWPIRLTGPVGGVEIRGGRRPLAPTNWLDCRLAISLLAWAPALRARGVVAIDHFSLYREQARVAGSDKPSGHASGRAIDLGRVELTDGRTLDVLRDWQAPTRGADPCDSAQQEEAGRVLQALVCDVAAAGLFQTIVTPHYNEAHKNHVHLEVTSPDGALWMR